MKHTLEGLDSRVLTLHKNIGDTMKSMDKYTDRMEGFIRDWIHFQVEMEDILKQMRELVAEKEKRPNFFQGQKPSHISRIVCDLAGPLPTTHI